jgi:hypothetical protein
MERKPLNFGDDFSALLHEVLVDGLATKLLQQQQLYVAAAFTGGRDEGWRE